MLSFAIGHRTNPIIITATVVAFINTGEPILGAIFDPLIGFFLDSSWTGKFVTPAGHIISQRTGPLDIKYFDLASYHYAFTTLVISMALSFIILLMIKDKQIEN